MHCHCGTNNRVPRWTFTDPCKPEVRPGAREESASPAWLAAPAVNARDTTKVYIWRLDTGCGPTLYQKCHSQKLNWSDIYTTRDGTHIISSEPLSKTGYGLGVCHGWLDLHGHSQAEKSWSDNYKIKKKLPTAGLDLTTLSLWSDHRNRYAIRPDTLSRSLNLTTRLQGFVVLFIATS